MRKHAAENRRDRMELASEAGYSKVSPGSVLAGVLVSYGAFAVLAALAGGILSALGVDIQAFSENDWRELGLASAIAVGAILFLSYLYGGYVAGRMARRAGAANGLGVFVLGILVAAGVGAAIGSQAGGDGLVDNLRSIGVPTSGEQFRSIGTITGIASLLAMLFGSVLGGVSGERWHGKLMTRALDPAVGPAVQTPARTEARHLDARAATPTGADDDTRLHRPVADDGVDVTDPSTTLDQDLTPEHTRTLR